MPHIHMIEFGDFLVNTGSEINDLPKEPQVDDRDYHRAVIKDVVSKFKASLKGKPRLWFEMQYPTPNDEPKTKEAYEKMVSSFITEHNPIGSTGEQRIMPWKNLKWNPAQERLDDFVYKFRRIATELGYNADENLEYFNCCVPSHFYFYLQGTTTIKEAVENIKRACALGGVSVQAAPVETRTIPTVPFIQMIDRQDSRTVPNSKDIVEITALEIKGVVDSIKRLARAAEKSLEKQSRRIGRDSRDSRNSRDNRRSYRSDSDSSSEDDSYHRYRSRSRDNSRNRSRSTGRSSKTCTYCQKPNHDLSHCYKLVKELKKLYSEEMKIDASRDEDEQARLDMLSCVKNYLESKKD